MTKSTPLPALFFLCCSLMTKSMNSSSWLQYVVFWVSLSKGTSATTVRATERGGAGTDPYRKRNYDSTPYRYQSLFNLSQCQWRASKVSRQRAALVLEGRRWGRVREKASWGLTHIKFKIEVWTGAETVNQCLLIIKDWLIAPASIHAWRTYI